MARILAVAVAFLLAAAHHAAAQRVALVIGNGAYREAPALANPAADARGMAAALARLGFSVDTVIDADRPAMERAIRRFGEAATGAEAAMVFYAGHAVEVGGRNFLIPVTAEIRSDRDLPFETIDFDAVMAQLEGRARVILIFLDACRDNPFRLRLMAGAARGVAAPGLAAVRGPVGTLVAFATAPGQVASDGRGTNSPFTAALLAHIETPGLEIRPMLGRVRQAVREATGGAQVPWENASLEGEFFFRAPPAAPPAVAALPAPAQGPSAARALPEGDQGAERRAWEAERLFWESVKDSRDAAELGAYLRRYPDGVFSDLARQRIAAIERGALPSPAAQPPQPARAQPPAAPPPPATAPPRLATPAPPAAVDLPLPPTPPEPAPQREAAARAPPPPAQQPAQQPVLRQPPAQSPAAARAPPPAPAAPSAGQGTTTWLLTHVVPLPPGPWRETSRWVEDSRPNVTGRSNQIHQLVLVQEREGRPVAAIWLRAIDSFGATTGWSVVGNCQGGDGRVAANLAASAGTQIDCWQVRRRRVTTNPLGRVLGEATLPVAQHAVGDARTLLQVDYAFADTPAERVAAWAPSAQEALLRGFNGRGGLSEGLRAP